MSFRLVLNGSSFRLTSATFGAWPLMQLAYAWHQQWQLRAYFATATTKPLSPSWLLSNVASHHMTADLNNLVLHLLSLLTFNLYNVIYVPSMKKNLIISLSQFCSQNNVNVEFSPTSFLKRIVGRGCVSWRDGVRMRFMNDCHWWHMLPLFLCIEC